MPIGNTGVTVYQIRGLLGPGCKQMCTQNARIKQVINISKVIYTINISLAYCLNYFSDFNIKHLLLSVHDGHLVIRH